MLHETIVAQQIDAVGRRHIEIYVLQVQQSSKPHTRFYMPPLHTQLLIYISVISGCMLGWSDMH